MAKKVITVMLFLCTIVVLSSFQVKGNVRAIANTVTDAKMITEEMTAKGSTQNADEKSESCVDWAKQKLTTSGSESDQENEKQQTHGQDVVDHAGEAATKTRDTVINAASGVTDQSFEETTPAVNLATDPTSGHEASNMESEKGGDAIQAAKKAYEDAKRMVDETYTAANEKTTEKAKANYEAAKERVSQATGDLGATMKNDDDEL